MTKLNELDATEMLDVARVLKPDYSAEKMDDDMRDFVQVKRSVLRHREKVAKRAAKLARRPVLH